MKYPLDLHYLVILFFYYTLLPIPPLNVRRLCPPSFAALLSHDFFRGGPNHNFHQGLGTIMDVYFKKD